MARYLTILEVSQKQAYIFSSNKLADNVKNSEDIACITNAGVIEHIIEGKGLFSIDKNYVYAGGGHTILEFETEEEAKNFNEYMTRWVHEHYPDMELYVTNCLYDERITPGNNLIRLTEKLERKKSIRRAAFHHGSFGIELINSNSLSPERLLVSPSLKKYEKPQYDFEKLLKESGFDETTKFEDLGLTKNDSSYIAVVHIDGNGMGKRISDFYENYDEHAEWDDFKIKLRAFSESIDQDYKDAYREMTEVISDQLKNEETFKELNIKKAFFPVRSIISSGDDICFVAEGRLGIEAAATYIRKINQKCNAIDNQYYSACAGVAIVHQKYPFFKAYELAEALCSNAKKFGASLSSGDNGASVSSIDWHIEQGEIRDSLSELRDVYKALDGTRMELRPYIINAPKNVLEKEYIRKFDNFEKLMCELKKKGDDNIRGKLKEMRSSIHKGKDEVERYLKFYKLDTVGRDTWYGVFEPLHLPEFNGERSNKPITYHDTADGINRSLLFDAIELMDTFILFDDATNGGNRNEN